MSHIVERFCNVGTYREAGLLVLIDNTSERRESSIWLSSAAILDIREHHFVTWSIEARFCGVMVFGTTMHGIIISLHWLGRRKSIPLRGKSIEQFVLRS